MKLMVKLKLLKLKLITKYFSNSIMLIKNNNNGKINSAKDKPNQLVLNALTSTFFKIS